MKTTTTQTKTYQVPTTIEVAPKAEEIDIYGMTEEDLDMLKKEDPFMYHSIPSVRKEAGFLVKNADQVSSTSLKTSHQATTKVTRKSHISVECYDRMTMEDDLLNDKEFVASGNQLDLLLESLFK